MKPSTFGLITLLAAGLPAVAIDPAFAQAPASSPSELRQVLKEEERVIVVTTEGRRLSGSVEAMTDTSLLIRMISGRELLPFERVREVMVRRRDPLWNGLLIGAGIGALGGLIPDYYDDCAECHDSLYGSIAFGAGVGLLVDALLHGGRLVYRARDTEASIALGWHVSSRGTGVTLRVLF